MWLPTLLLAQPSLPSCFAPYGDRTNLLLSSNFFSPLMPPPPKVKRITQDREAAGTRQRVGSATFNENGHLTQAVFGQFDIRRVERQANTVFLHPPRGAALELRMGSTSASTHAGDVDLAVTQWDDSACLLERLLQKMVLNARGQLLRFEEEDGRLSWTYDAQGGLTAYRSRGISEHTSATKQQRYDLQYTVKEQRNRRGDWVRRSYFDDGKLMHTYHRQIEYHGS
jgi:YD repeat-containing protein